MTIFDELREDHDTQRDLARRLCDTTGDSERRQRLFDELSAHLEAHARAEERCFYTELLGSDLTQEKARHSIHEHEQIDDLVAKLEAYDRSAPIWLQTAQELREKVDHHLDEEEHQVFQLAGRALSESQKSDLGIAYRRLMSEALV